MLAIERNQHYEPTAIETGTQTTCAEHAILRKGLDANRKPTGQLYTVILTSEA